jgi:hypothetical protein
MQRVPTQVDCVWTAICLRPLQNSVAFLAMAASNWSAIA